MSDDVKVVVLSEPIKHDGQDVKELRFRKPKARDFRNMPMNPTMGDLMDVAGKMCGMLSTEMDELSYADMIKVADVLGEAMPHTPSIGGKP
jgi:hypothetical protein